MTFAAASFAYASRRSANLRDAGRAAAARGERAHVDFETRSAADLRKTGAERYAEDLSTDAWCMAWAIGEERPHLWAPDAPGEIDRLRAFVETGGVVVAHSAPFELAIWNRLMVRRYRWPALAIEQTRCTMAMALALAIPAGLDGAAAAVSLPIRKDKDGAALMRKMAKPRKVYGPGEADAAAKRRGKPEPSDEWTTLPDGTQILWWGGRENRARLGAYCVQDVAVERDLEKRLMPLIEVEQRVWALTQRVNDRGVQVDLRAVQAAQHVYDEMKLRLDARMREITGGAVAGCTKVAQLVTWLGTLGVRADGAAKADVVDLLERPDLPADARAALQLRQAAAKSSLGKLKAMLLSACADGRCRGVAQYHGAATGRWAGRRVQFQNVPRPDLPQAEIEAVLDMLSAAEIVPNFETEDDDDDVS